MPDLKKQYEAEIKRINKLISFHELRGLKFKGDVIPEAPKQITESTIEDLRKIDFKYVQSKSFRNRGGVYIPYDEAYKVRVKHDDYQQKKGVFRQGNPQNLNRKGNPQNLQHRGNIQNLAKGWGRKRLKGVSTRPFTEKHTILKPIFTRKGEEKPQVSTRKKSPKTKSILNDISSIVIRNFKDTLDIYSNAVGAVYVENLIDRLIAHYGKEAVADVINEIGGDVSYETFYDYTANNQFLNKILDTVKAYVGDDDYIENLREATNNIDDFGDYQLAQENKYVRTFAYRGYVDITKQKHDAERYYRKGVTEESIATAMGEPQIDRYIKAIKAGLIVDVNYTGSKDSVSKNWAIELDRLDKSQPNWELV